MTDSPYDARHFRSLAADAHGLNWFTELPSIINGVLLYTSSGFVDELFDDVHTTRIAQISGRDYSPFDPADQMYVLSGLPGKFAVQYNVRFAQMFTATAVDLTAQLTGTWVGPTSIAQQLALHLLITQAAVTIDLFDLPVESHWREEVDLALFANLDHLRLYTTESMDADTAEDRMAWFTPFRQDIISSPYTLPDAW